MAANETTMTEVEKAVHEQVTVVAHKGSVTKNMDVSLLRLDPHLNIRFRPGKVLHGITITADTYNLPDIMAKIDAMNGIHTPILVSERSDKSLIVLQGNRRTRGAQEMLLDPNLRPELRKILTTMTPVRILKGLTPEQERELVQDQEQKQFMRSECLEHLWAQKAAGKSYGAIVLHNEVMCRKFVNNPKKAAEVDEEVATMTTTERNARIQKWLRGSIDMYILAAYSLGDYIRKQTLLSEMRLDKLLKASDEQPYFLTTNNSQKRMEKLNEARKKDGSNFNGYVPQEGSEFKKVIDAFHTEDFGPVVIKDDDEKEKKAKMLKKDEVESLQTGFQSRVAKLVLDRVLGKEVPDVQAADDFASIQEAKAQVANSIINKVKPEIAGIVRLCLVNTDPMELDKFLKANQIDG